MEHLTLWVTVPHAALCLTLAEGVRKHVGERILDVKWGLSSAISPRKSEEGERRERYNLLHVVYILTPLRKKNTSCGGVK